jgi:hypothetical protein
MVVDTSLIFSLVEPLALDKVPLRALDTRAELINEARILSSIFSVT